MAEISPELKAIFWQALDCPSEAERRAYLDRACAGDAALRSRIDALLVAHQDVGDFLEEPVPNPTVSWGSPTPLEAPGTVIGPYKLREQIGEGGMGVVYVAEQTQPVRRKVALKIIKPGMDTKQVIARFEAERQALALMDHPNIAKVLDAGTTDSGRPYFVMELVRGIPITEYCDRQRLAIPERLEPFVQVCRAVQHAHQKGIIHRDLKPSNILVTVIDGAAVPKVIDFGVAKATGASLTERTIYTAFHQFVGTPLYMSPEQADLSGMDVDTRSDIYSLGVLLYELLTGTTPFDQDTFRTAALDEVRRIIREQEPPKPSTRISTLEATATTLSANRQTDPWRLRKSLRGELDWIVMKCLEKDRNRRYDSANSLVTDLRRYLNHEVVEAGPPSIGYRLRKAARRNRAALVTALVLATALVAGTAVSTWEAIRAMKAEGLAENRLEAERAARQEASRLLGQVTEERNRVTQERNRADVARQEADRRATEAREVVDFLINDLIGAAGPSRAQGQLPTVDQVLAQADQNIAKRFADRPLIEASIRHALGKAYEELGKYPKAEEHAARAVALRLAHLRPEHADTIAAQNELGWVLSRQGQAGREKARTLLDPVLAIARKALGPGHPEMLHTMDVLASAQDKSDEARALQEELLAIRKRVLPPEHPMTLATMSNLAKTFLWEGHPEQAEQLYEQVLRVSLRDQPNHPDTLDQMSVLASVYAELQQYDRAIDMGRRVVEGRLHVLGLAHPRTWEAIVPYFASARRDRTHWEGARKALESILERSRRELGPTDDPSGLWIRIRLALLLRELGRFAEARPLLEQAAAGAVRLRQEASKPSLQIEAARGIAQLLLRQWPGLAPGISPAARPPASFTIEAPFRAKGPVADGRIDPGEYGPGVEVTFDGDANPGRLYLWGKSRSKTPDDLSVRVHTAYTPQSLFLAFRVRDQFIDAGGQDANGPWFNDGVDVFINGDQVANDYGPGRAPYSYFYKGFREGFALTADAGGRQVTQIFGNSAFTNADWKVGSSRTPDGYLIEFEIPLTLIDTRDGPEYVPATGGDQLRVNFGITDNDASVSEQADYGIFWAEDPALTPHLGGEDFWTVALRLVPKPAGP